MYNYNILCAWYESSRPLYVHAITDKDRNGVAFGVTFSDLKPSFVLYIFNENIAIVFKMTRSCRDLLELEG